MKHSSCFSRFLALLCAALALGLLAGCTPKKGSDSVISAVSKQPTAEQEVSPLADVLSLYLEVQPGSSGSTLKAVSPSLALLRWAGDNHAAALESSHIALSFVTWYNALDDSTTGRTCFEEAWSDYLVWFADTLFTDRDEALALMEDAGFAEKDIPDTTAEDWYALRDVISEQLQELHS